MTNIFSGPLNSWVLGIGSFFTLIFVVLYFTKLKSRQLLNYLPNIWTSLGILGTFVAIVNSLHNVQDLKGDLAVSELVRSIAPAFVTSIIGIIGAIITSVFNKFVYAVEDRKEEKLYTDAVGKITPELMLDRINRSIERLITISQNQESNIKSFLDNFVRRLDTFYDKIYESNKAQVATLSDEYVQSVARVLEESDKKINKRIDELLLAHSEGVREHLMAEQQKLDEIAVEIKSFLNGIPDTVDGMKNELAHVLRETIIEKYSQLLDSNNILLEQMMQRVKAFEAEVAAATTENCTQTLSDTRVQIQRIITLLENSLESQTESLRGVYKEMAEDLAALVATVDKSGTDYRAMVEQMDKFIPVLQEHVKHSENNMAAAEQNTACLQDVLTTLEEIAKKNQQLRYELTQWKRVHKKVKINDKNGTKECPNCGAENPIDANFCRKCNYGFWDCETIASGLN